MMIDIQAAATAVPMDAAPAPMTDAQRAAALRAKCERNEITTRDMSFVMSLLNGFRRYGSFTDRQRPHVDRLIAPPAAPTGTGTGVQVLRPHFPRLADMFVPGRLARLTVGPIQIVRKHEEALCFVKLEGRIVAVMERGELRSTRGMRGPEERKLVLETMTRIEADPVAAAHEHGTQTGRCSVCSRELTADRSIERAMGPICFRRLTGLVL